MYKTNYTAVIITAIVFFLNPLSTFSQIVMENTPGLQEIDVAENPGGQIPLELEFLNDSGDTVALGDFFKKDRPVLLTLAYYECPMLCTFVLNGLTKGAYELAFTPGDEYQIVTVSIDPGETPELAASKKRVHLEALNKYVAPGGWEFLVGNETNIKALADSVGFQYYYDAERDEYAHPAVSYIITSNGKISRYLYGLEYKESDLRLALLEASDGKIGNTLDKILLFCYHYDPDAKGYVIFAGNVMKLGGLITVLLLGITLVVLWRKDFLGKLGVNQ